MPTLSKIKSYEILTNLEILFDIVPKIKILSEAYNLRKINYFYFSKLNSYQRETFKIFKLKGLSA